MYICTYTLKLVHFLLKAGNKGASTISSRREFQSLRPATESPGSWRRSSFGWSWGQGRLIQEHIPLLCSIVLSAHLLLLSIKLGQEERLWIVPHDNYRERTFAIPSQAFKCLEPSPDFNYVKHAYSRQLLRWQQKHPNNLLTFGSNHKLYCL